MGCADSAGAADYFSQQGIKSYALFKDFFAEYPAHFHINVHPKAQGRGVGSRLVSRYVEELQRRKISGAHVVTAADNKNRKFFLNNGFTFEERRAFNDLYLSFMGRIF